MLQEEQNTTLPDEVFMARKWAIRLEQKGNFKKTHRFLQSISNKHYDNILNKYGKMGVEALKRATPVDSGKTADSWYYEIRTSKELGYYAILFYNSNVVNEWANIAILLQYGHGTRNGGYVEGRDYINPAIQPVFDELADKVWEEIEKA